MGDTRLVAVISTRIGCGVSDATTRVGSRMTGDSAMFCTWPPMLSIAVSSGVLAAVVQMDDERVMPCFRDYAGHLGFGQSGHTIAGQPGSCSADRTPTTDRTPPENFAMECHCLSVNMCALYSHLRHLARVSTGQVALVCLHKTGWESSVLRPSTHPGSVPPRGGRELCRTDTEGNGPCRQRIDRPSCCCASWAGSTRELALQRRLSAMTVHDLANPAQVILGLSEVLLEHQILDPLVRRRLEQVHRSAVTMTALITDLSSGSRPRRPREPGDSSGSTSASW